MDLSTAPELAETLTQFATGAVFADPTGVTFLDSSGIIFELSGVGDYLHLDIVHSNGRAASVPPWIESITEQELPWG